MTHTYKLTNTCFLKSWHSSGVRVSAFAIRGMTLTLSWSLFMNSMSSGFSLKGRHRERTVRIRNNWVFNTFNVEEKMSTAELDPGTRLLTFLFFCWQCDSICLCVCEPRHRWPVLYTHCRLGTCWTWSGWVCIKKSMDRNVGLRLITINN